ncbi:sigma-70 family RNA polymerase sigma factor [Brevundimonas sp.]|uniref:RNA polymerase sigma factor n=1 Tax=Brevundimonas sp. TaxID=1871086 RepID=UPI0025F29437|nr:sigma-70 family RNA polymerase sigma factor [Brevundimonas sp.]
MTTAESRVLDEYLVVCARAGDRRAFEHLARRWNRRLVAHAWRLTGDPEAARDAAQSAWIEIARGLARLEDERAFPAWAYRIVSRRCARLIDGRRRDRELTRDLAAQPASEPGDVGTVATTPALARAISALPPGQRAAIALHHFEDMSIAETAVALDVPAGTVKTRLMHARRALRAALEGA